MRYAYYIELPLEFPEGVHFGAGKRRNSLVIARDGKGNPVLNGTSIAGVMRSIWRDYQVARIFGLNGKSHREISQLRKEKEVADRVSLLFGAEQDKLSEEDAENPMPLDEKESRVKVTNYELVLGDRPVDDDQVKERTHHLRNRHRGTVLEKQLFSLEACAPGTGANVGFWVFDKGTTTNQDIKEFLGVVVAAFAQGVFIGGNSNRGVGRAVVNPDNVRYRDYDLTILDRQAEQIDAHRNWRLGRTIDGLEKFPDELLNHSDREKLTVEFTLSVPRGQDVLVGDGQAEDVQLEPQRVQGKDDVYFWRIPGSSVRGAFRKWFNHLAAREGHTTVDAADEYEVRIERGNYTGENLGWCFQNRDNVEQCESFDREKHGRPIVSLFGSCFNPGRIKINDGLARCCDQAAKIEESSECQTRMHVAVDRITGGAAEGMLFSTRVLTAGANGNSPAFAFKVTIVGPQEHEARWLAQTLTALDFGVLRIGSSKSSGRLSLQEPPAVIGKYHEEFNKHFRKAE